MLGVGCWMLRVGGWYTVAMEKYAGFGIGLRPTHYQAILAGEAQGQVDWFEIISEDFLSLSGEPQYYLEKIAEQYPLAMHGVSMSIGSADPLNMDYMAALKKLADQVQPLWVSDHLCWTGVEQVNSHDLLPMPYTVEAVQHLAAKIKQAQDYLGRQMLFENVSSYVEFEQADMTEWDFVNAVSDEADCMILLDVNNIYVNAFNHNFEASTYLNAINPERVYQYHIAGHLNKGEHIIDTHDNTIIDPVWDLYRQACSRFKDVATLIERDSNIPPLSDLLVELAEAKKIAQQSLSA